MTRGRVVAFVLGLLTGLIGMALEASWTSGFRDSLKRNYFVSYHANKAFEANKRDLKDEASFRARVALEALDAKVDVLGDEAFEWTMLTPLVLGVFSPMFDAETTARANENLRTTLTRLAEGKSHGQ